jgi:DNA-binding CsgD family transcriptional regulator
VRLGAEIRALLLEARDVLAVPESSADERFDLEAVTSAARAAGDERAIALGLRAQDLLHVLHTHHCAHRDALLSQVQEGLRRLAPVTSSSELLDRVCAEVKRSCGFERVLLSRVDEGAWKPWMLDFDDGEIEHEMIDAMRDAAFAFTASPIEQRVLAGRRPEIVGRVRTEHEYAPILGVSRSASYVVVPVAPAGRVVGLLHGDHGPDGRRVDLVDRDVLWVFAEGFGRIYERTELQERLRAQRQRVADALGLLESTIDDVLAARMHIGPTPPAPEFAAAPVANPAIDTLLTDRERDVLHQMVRGRNNAAIAEQLVISEGTVKSHVKHILRKVGAVNRTEAISLYLAAHRGPSPDRRSPS